MYRIECRKRRILALALGVAAGACSPIARADCIDAAAAHHRVDAVVLRAIGWHESGLRPWAIGHNRNGTIDLGAFQVNSVHHAELARYGIAAASLADGCTSAYVAAWLYRREIDRLGNTWAAVGAYHSRTPSNGAAYANQIAALLMRWQAMPDGPLPYPRASAHSPSPLPAVPTDRPVPPGSTALAFLPPAP